MLTFPMRQRRIPTVASAAERASIQPRTAGLLAVLSLLCGLGQPGAAQSASNGAISGIVTDPADGVVAGAKITATNQATGEKRAVESGGRGAYLIPFLSPGTYKVEASVKGFRPARYLDVRVAVTETIKVDIRLVLGAAGEAVTVAAEVRPLQTESTDLGQVMPGEIVNSLPLVTRNYTQIIALNPGVAADVTSAAGVGRGGNGSAEPGSAVVAHGTSGQDNNYQMNGVEINDLQNSGHFSGGIAIPNPDSIEEFRVQTGQYDASYGRDAGANVDVVTKGGSNVFHGTIFEYLRNEDLNANDFFFNLNSQPRGVLRQNQPGFAVGGPYRGTSCCSLLPIRRRARRTGSRRSARPLFQGRP